MRPFIRYFLLFAALSNAGCATLFAAALSGGNDAAIEAGAAVDAAFFGAIAASALQDARHEEVHRQQTQQVIVHVHNNITMPANPNAEEVHVALREPIARSSFPQRRTRDQVGAVIFSRIGELEKCREALPSMPEGTYRAYCRFRIQPNGVPTGIEIRVYEPPALQACVQEVIGEWRFPEAELGTAVSVPLTWQSASPMWQTTPIGSSGEGRTHR